MISSHVQPVFLFCHPGVESAEKEDAYRHRAILFGCRLILFLQQSSVEWCSSLWMHVIQEVDPNFQRTVGLTARVQLALQPCILKALQPAACHLLL